MSDLRRERHRSRRVVEVLDRDGDPRRIQEVAMSTNEVRSSESARSAERREN